MAATDDKTNFYVMDAAIDSLADNINGGTMYTGNGQTYVDGRPAETYSNVDAVSLGGSEYTLENKDNGGWGTTDVDDQICWDTAGTVEFVRVLELDYGSDSDVIRVYAVSDATITVATGKSVYVGGAWKTIDFPCGMVDNTWTNAAGDPITIWIKNGTYAEDMVIVSGGTALSYITYEGYKTTPGDGPAEGMNGTIPEIQGTGTAAATLHVPSGKDYLSFVALKFTQTTASKHGVYNLGDYCSWEHCYCKTTGVGGSGISNVNGYANTFTKCYIEGVLNGISASSLSIGIINCDVVFGGAASNSGIIIGPYSTANNNKVRYVGTDTTAVKGIESDGVVSWIVGNTIDGIDKLTSGIFLDTGYIGTCENNLVSNINGYGLDSDHVHFILNSYNAFYNCSSGNINTTYILADNDVGNVTVTADPYTNHPTDLTLNSNTPGGGQCRAAGYPSYRDIGSLQHEDVGGTTVIVSHRKVR